MKQVIPEMTHLLKKTIHTWEKPAFRKENELTVSVLITGEWQTLSTKMFFSCQVSVHLQFHVITLYHPRFYSVLKHSYVPPVSPCLRFLILEGSWLYQTRNLVSCKPVDVNHNRTLLTLLQQPLCPGAHLQLRRQTTQERLVSVNVAVSVH